LVLYGTTAVHISTSPVYATINMKVKKQLYGASRTLGLWAIIIPKKESIVLRDLSLVLFTIESSISSVTEMLEDFFLIVWLNRVPLHGMRARARRARPSTFLVLKAKESTRGRLETARE
jgi:hypothetical protein